MSHGNYGLNTGHSFNHESHFHTHFEDFMIHATLSLQYTKIMAQLFYCMPISMFIFYFLGFLGMGRRVGTTLYSPIIMGHNNYLEPT